MGLVREYLSNVRQLLYSLQTRPHTPREVAQSFGFGSFITVLPTLGLGLVLFALIGMLTDRVSKLGLFASVVVFNPFIKSGIYVASFAIGIGLLGPIDPTTIVVDAPATGSDIIIRLLIGNVILAFIAGIGGYWVVLRLLVNAAARDKDATVSEFVMEYPK